MKHKHYDMILAWAEGKKIQGRQLNIGRDWENVTFPHWWNNWEYRVTPEPVLQEGWATPSPIVSNYTVFSLEKLNEFSSKRATLTIYED